MNSGMLNKAVDAVLSEIGKIGNVRERLTTLVNQWDDAAAAHRDMAQMVEGQTGKRDTRWHGQREMLELCARQVRNVLAGRDAEDDGA